MKRISSLTFIAILYFSIKVDAQKKWTEKTKGKISVITNNRRPDHWVIPQLLV